MARTMHLFEALCADFNVGLALVLKARITPSNLKDAFELTKTEHPALRMVIEDRDDGTKAFVEKPDIGMELVCKPTRSGDSVDWREQLQAFVNTPRDHAVSPTYFEFYPSCTDTGPHLLLVVMNHAGMDGRGLFQIFNSFCRFLGAIVSGTEPPEPQPHEFVDIMEIAKTNGVVDIPKPDVPEDILPRFELQKVDLNGDVKPTIRAYFNQMTEEMTKKLIKNAKVKGFTIQGALSASAMIGAGKGQAEKHPLPKTMSYLAPVDMRNMVDPPVDNLACVCGVSYVQWCQDVSPTSTLAEVAVCASKSLREQLDRKMALAIWHWYRTENGWIPTHTLRDSSVGVNPIQSQYEDLEVCSVDMMEGSYGTDQPDWATFMTHIHTFGGKLRSTQTHSWPAISTETARLVFGTQWACLHALALDNADSVTVEDFFKQAP